MKLLELIQIWTTSFYPQNVLLALGIKDTHAIKNSEEKKTTMNGQKDVLSGAKLQGIWQYPLFVSTGYPTILYI